MLLVSLRRLVACYKVAGTEEIRLRKALALLDSALLWLPNDMTMGVRKKAL